MEIRLILIFILFLSNVNGQDIHYTQWMNAPYQYSPSLAGQFDGTHRIIANHRNQWSSVTVPFITFGAMADSRTLLKIPRLNAIGGVLYDVTGDSRFTTMRLQLGASYEIPLLNDSIGSLFLGVLPSINQRRLNLKNLNFDSQFNGFLFDENLSSNESLSTLSNTYFDLSLGSHFNINLSKKASVILGASMYNVFKPKQSFFEDNSITLDSRYNVFSELSYQYNAKWKFLPGLLISKQGTYYSRNFGLRSLLDLSESIYLKQSLILGAYLRTYDSGDLIVGYEYDSWTFTGSYDFNFSDLVPASNYRGGIELSIIYIFKDKIPAPKFKFCPDYL